LRVLVTGTEGYLGCLVAPILFEDGHDVVGLDTGLRMAELSNDPVGDLVGDVTFEVNHRGSVHSAECAKRAGVTRFIYMASCSMHGISNKSSICSKTGQVDECLFWRESQ
jgi:nucleoside-diphosphate-sugar epimerase